MVPGLAYTVVLGRDFLHNNGAILTAQNKYVMFDPQNNRNIRARMLTLLFLVSCGGAPMGTKMVDPRLQKAVVYYSVKGGFHCN